MRRKQEMRLQPFQIVAIVFLLGTVLLLEWFTIQTFAQKRFIEREITKIETAELADAKSYVEQVETVTETIGKTMIMTSYPTDAEGVRNASIEETLNQQLALVKQEAEQQTTPTWVYLKVYQTNVFKNVKDVYYYKAVYQEKESKIEQVTYQELLHQLVSSEAEGSAALSDLFVNDLVATNFFVKRAIQIADEKGLDSTKRSQLLEAFAEEQWKKLPVAILQNAFRFTLPQAITTDSGEDLTEVTVAFQEMFAVLKSSEIPDSEKDAYDRYQAQVAERLQQKRVAITFDDGPNTATTPQVLEILRRYGVHATFYIMGKHVPGNEAIIQQLVKEGHELGNHSYSHPLLTEKTGDEVYHQVSDTQSLIAHASGGIKPTTLRPPYGGFDAMVAHQAGIALVNWSVDTEDWKSHNPHAILQEVVHATYPGAIILMHDIHQDTVDSLEAVLDYLVSEGYQIGSIEELMAYQPMEAGYMYFDRTSKIAVE